MANIGQTTLWSLQFLLTTLVMVWPGNGFYRIGLPALLRGAPEMNSLVALGTLAAWGYSTVVLFAPGLLPADARQVYFEPAAVIVTLILLGRWLEARARGRTEDAIRGLRDLQPRTARVQTATGSEDRPVAQLRTGDIILIRPGEAIAADGEVIEGHSAVNEASESAMCTTNGQWLHMKMTNKPEAPSKSCSETSRPSTLIRVQFEAFVPRGNIVLAVLTIAQSSLP